jgi:LPXTG-motif cell wall-anchored protein
MKKWMLLTAVLAMMLAFAAPALAQTGNEQVKADSICEDGMIEAQAGDAVAKAPCTPPPPPPPPAPAPKATPAPPPPPPPAPAPAPAPASPPAELPKSGGVSTTSLFALGAGALLVGGGLIARRIVKK